MGQQQLLLLVLGIVIVGLAVVVGIQAFSENMKKANSDALVNDAIRIASDLQAWKLKPAAFGGGASGDWSTADFTKLGYDVLTAADDGCAIGDYQNMNGCFDLTAAAGSVTIAATSLTSGAQDNSITVVVSGTTPAAIATTIN